MLGLPYFWRKKDTQPEQETITIELCKHIPELFNTDGPASIKKALKQKLEDAEKELWQIRKPFQKNLDKFNKKLQPKIDALDKKTNTLHRAWEKWQAETAKKKTAYIDSNDELTAVVAKKEKIEIANENLESERQACTEKVEQATDDISLVETLLQLNMDDRPLGKNQDNTVEGRREAVQDKIQHIGQLKGMEPVRCLEILTFLRSNGVVEASGSWRTKPQILRLRVARVLFPDDCPRREESLSPASKAKAVAKELFDDAQEAATEEQKEKEYKRKVEREATSFKTPAAKKAKLSPPSPAQNEFLKSVLTEEQFNEYIGMVGTDAEEDLDEEDQEEGGQVPMEETSPQQQQQNDGTTEG